MDLWRKERIQSVLYKAVKQEDVEMAAKCLKMGAVDVNTRYEPVRSFITRNSNVGVHIRMSKYVYSDEVITIDCVSINAKYR